MNAAAKNTGKWSARCDCYHGHASASGRCRNREVHDPTARAGTDDGAICDDCRRECVPDAIAARSVPALLAENELYREALREIAEATCDHGPGICCRDLARSALAAGGKA